MVRCRSARSPGASKLMQQFVFERLQIVRSRFCNDSRNSAYISGLHEWTVVSSGADAGACDHAVQPRMTQTSAAGHEVGTKNMYLVKGVS
jgi:hypothetical protein